MHRTLLAQKPYHKLRNNFATTPVTTAAWVQLSASLPKACTAIEYANTGNGILKLSVGAAGLEDASELLFYILPGGSAILVPVEIAGNVRLSAKAVDQDSDDGDLVMNFYG